MTRLGCYTIPNAEAFEPYHDLIIKDLIHQFDKVGEEGVKI